MNSRDAWWGFGDGAQWFLGLIYDNIGNIFNYSMIVLGFIGLFYWLAKQKGFNDQAANNPNQLK